MNLLSTLTATKAPNAVLLIRLMVGSFEIACAMLVLLGLLTRLAVIPLLTIMAVALYSTKLPILLQSGFWKMAHEARTGFSILQSLCSEVSPAAWAPHPRD